MSKTLTGARCKMYVDNQLVGIFETVSYSSNYGTEPIHLLGRYSAAEIVITSAEAVTINASGFRIVGQGVHVLPKVPKVQDLLNFEAITLAVEDRQTGQVILTALGCVPNAYNGNHNARATSRVSVSYTGLIAQDESGSQSESPGATELP